MRKMKDSGVEWIGEIPESWTIIQTRRLFRNEKQIVGDSVDQYQRLALTLKGVIKRSKEDSEGLQPEKFEGYQILRENELVFKMIDLENVNTSRVGLSPYTGLVSPAYIVLKNDNTDNRYAYYWFMFMYYQEVFNNLGGAGVRSALNDKDILALPIPNISKDEQKKIADYLDEKCSKIDDIIVHQEEIIEKLKEYKLSLYSEQIANSFGKQVALGKIITDIEQGWSPSPSEKKNDNGWNVLTLAAVKYGKFDSKEVKEFIGDQEKCERLVLKDGDFLLTRSNTRELVGQVCIVNNVKANTIFSDLIYRLTFNLEYIDPEYALYYFQSPQMRQQISRDAHGSSSTMVKITHKNISNWTVMLPSIEKQKEIVSLFKQKEKSILYEIAKRECLIEKLVKYKKSLIYEVVTGKREVL